MNYDWHWLIEFKYANVTFGNNDYYDIFFFYFLAPTIIQNAKYETLSDGSVHFQWDAPFGRGGDIIEYVVSYGDTSLRLSSTSTTFTIGTDTQDREYFVQVSYSSSIIKVFF